MINSQVEKIRADLIAARILPLESQAVLWSEILLEKFSLLPSFMKSANVDMWLIISRENCEDPVFKTMATWDMPHARRLTVLVFALDSEGNMQKIILGGTSPEMSKLYSNGMEEGETPWQALSRIISKYNPKKIAIDKSENYGFCDGLSSTLHDQLLANLSPEYTARLVSGEDISVRWLEQVCIKEQHVMQVLVKATQDIIKMAYSRDFITVGKTTTTDIEWFMRNTILSLGFDFWFGPDVDLQRQGNPASRIFGETIQEGDLLHCDIGVVCRYIQLNTDIQWLAYVLKGGETSAPRGLSTLLALGNHFQDIVAENFEKDRTGNDIFALSIERAKEEGIEATLYTHPLGTFGHGAGPTIGLYNEQRAIPGKGERKIENNTCFALELNVKASVPEWTSEAYAYLEEDVIFTDKLQFINGRETQLILI